MAKMAHLAGVATSHTELVKLLVSREALEALLDAVGRGG